MTLTLCGCIRCYSERMKAMPADTPLEQRIAGVAGTGWRYACEVCGNKRCPHHSDHRLACTNSNEVGQIGSVFQWTIPAG